MNKIRDIGLTPSKWVGDGLLGCEMYMGVHFTINTDITDTNDDGHEVDTSEQHCKCNRSWIYMGIATVETVATIVQEEVVVSVEQVQVWFIIN